MCGIVGIISRKIGGLYAPDLELFEQALIINTIRGKDGVGAFTAFKNKQAKAIKHGSNPFELFKTKEWSEWRSEALSRGRFVMGHNRYSTRGASNTDNAHPFVEENIILIHNGTIHNEEQLTKNKVEVDSNAIAHALVEKTPQEVFPNIMGAFACVWFDVTKQKLFVIRNDQRPLSMIVSEEYYFLSSEPWIMCAPANRQNRKIGDIIDIKPGDLYEFDMEGKYTVTTLDMTKKAQRSTGAATTTTSTTRTGASSVIPFKNGGSDTTLDTTTTDFFETGISDQAEAGSPEGRTLLRQALTLQRERKIAESMRTSGYVLTRRGDTKVVSALTSTTENDSITSLIVPSVPMSSMRNGVNDSVAKMVGWAGPILPVEPTENDREALTIARNVVETDDWVPGRVVLIRILRNFSDFRSRVRFTGKLLEPGMEMVDVTGFVPEGTMMMPATVALGRIFFTTLSVHGPEVFLTNPTFAKYTAVHTTEVPTHLYRMAYREGICSSCEQELKLSDKPFTSVTNKALFGITKSGIPLNTLTCICADCIQDKLPEGPYRETFIAKRRNAAQAQATQEKPYVIDPRDPLQTSVILSKDTGRDHRAIPRVESSQTLH